MSIFRDNRRNWNGTSGLGRGTRSLMLGVLLWAGCLVPTDSAYAQLQRERVEEAVAPDPPFGAMTLLGVGTVYLPDAGSLNLSVAHLFGPVQGGIDRFFGLDDGANTRIGLDWGVTDRWSLGLGRMAFENVVDLRSTWLLLRQTGERTSPVDVALKGALHVRTLPGLGLSFRERLVGFSALHVARRFEKFALQVSPMVAEFGRTVPGDPTRIFGVGVLGWLPLNDRFSLGAEYLPVIGDRMAGSQDAFSIIMGIDTGGHEFQIFLSSSQWHSEPFLMARSRDSFFAGDLRIGFNIHRVFGLAR
ncbi:MAG: DUF5777 family beta-barrel protein [Bacteroidota bacterium]